MKSLIHIKDIWVDEKFIDFGGSFAGLFYFFGSSSYLFIFLFLSLNISVSDSKYLCSLALIPSDHFIFLGELFIQGCLLSLCLHVQYPQSCPTLWGPIVAHQAPRSMEFSRQEYWSVLPCPPPRDLPDPGTEPASPASPALQVDSLLLSHGGRIHA